MKNDFRILLTENCNANCPNCFNSSYRKNKDMDLEKFQSLCLFLSTNGIKKLKIMGGEPTVHYDFNRAMEIAKKYFYKTYLFTNGISSNLLNYNPRAEDVIIYNLNLIKVNDSTDKFLLNKPGFRSFEIQIGSRCDVKTIIDKLTYLNRIFHNKKKLIMNLTLDCTENIFENRDAIINNWTAISDFIINNLKTNFNIDHIIPQCFMQESKIFNFTPRPCNYLCAGLIDTDFKLRFCNQYPIIINDVFKFEDISAIECALKEAYSNKLNLSKQNRCESCPNFNISCNGGCFTHKEIFSKKSKE